jgi:hypothetical protein
MAENIEVILDANTSGLTSGLDRAKKSVNSAAYALNDLSRIAQDAPYGFIGISNNINPLVESFGRLRASSGGTSGALKEMLSALTGPAGVGLAFGLLSAAISFASVGLSRWIQTSKEAKNATDEITEAVKKQAEALAAEGKEIQFVADTNDYLLQVSLNNARARGASTNELRKIEEDYWTNARYDAEEAVRLANKNLETKRKELKEQGNIYTGLVDYVKGTKYNYEKESKIIDEYVKALADRRKEQQDIERKYAISTSKNRADDYEDQKQKNAAKLKEQEKYNKNYLAYLELLRQQARRDSIAKVDKLPFGDSGFYAANLASEFNKNKAIFASPQFTQLFRIPIIPTIEIPKLESREFYEALEETTQIMKQLTVDMVSTLAEGIGNAISGGGSAIGEAFKGIFTLFGDAIIKLGKNAILFSKGFAVLKKALEAGKPILGIGAGIGLIAIGAAMKAAASGGMKFATGTTNAPGGMALVGERGPELVNIPRGSQVIPNGRTSAMLGGIGGGVEVYGVLRGQDIYFSNKKYAQTYNRTT